MILTILLFVSIALYWILILVLVLSALFFLAIQLFPGENKQVRREIEGSVLVMVPCRGVDFTLKETLESIRDLEYSGFQAVCIVDSEDDPSVPIIREVGLRTLISSAACKDCSGKVRALCTAMMETPGFDYYVIADSDIIVERDWLSCLLSPLHDERVGLSTTFPVFQPDSKFWSKMKSVWGMVGLSMMKSRRTRFGWGGSLAFRRDLVDGYMPVFCSSVSDDVALSKICGKKALDIQYVEDARAIIRVKESRKSFFEWANRQTSLSVSSGGRVLAYGLAYFLAQCILIVSSLLLSFLVYPVFLLLLLPFATQSLRYRQVHRRLPASVVFIEFILPFVYSYNLLHAALVKDIEWRGRKYTLQKFRDL